MLWLVSFAFSKEEEEEEEEEEHGQSVFACISYLDPVIFSSNFFAGSYFFTCSPP